MEVTGAGASSQTLLLWTRSHPMIQVWTLAPKLELLDATGMAELGYPHPPSGRDLCRSLADERPPPPGVDATVVEALSASKPFGAPVAITWAELLGGR